MLRVWSCFVLALAAVPAVAQPGPSGAIRVIDADTWEVGGARVRLFGIDAPEKNQTCEWPDGREWPCGRWATLQARARFEGLGAKCEQLDVDRYRRIVARCRVGGVDAGRWLVSEGIAFAYRAYSQDYVLDEKGAAVNARGIHSARVQTPSEFRKSSRNPVPAPAPRDGCAIKGNISASGKRIYHVPGQRDYDATRITAEKGERWFCSEAQARRAGWRRARR